MTTSPTPQEQRQLRVDHAINQHIATLGFVEAMVALGWIEDEYGVIDAFFNGLLTQAEATQIENEQQVWQDCSTGRIRAVLKEVAA